MEDEFGNQLLKGVSRSFYLTLRLLPGPMRRSASLGYLIARTSDTLADAHGVSPDDRLSWLEEYCGCVETGGFPKAWPRRMFEAVSVKERLLLEQSAPVLDELRRTEAREAALIREVVAVIISGQKLDLRRFSRASAVEPVSLSTDEALEDYAWRVAGCVGEFWTKLGFLTMGGSYSDEMESVLLERGIAYGKGLQLVNILRDLPEDLAAGRCYLPVADPNDREEVMESFRRWHWRACRWVGEGIKYAETLKSRRLRTATVLPALVAEETLNLLEGASWERLGKRVKVPRWKVYRMLAEGAVF